MSTHALAPGDEIPTISREGRLEVWTRFAAVNDEFAAHHMDDEVCRHEGFPAAFGMAPLSFALVHTLLRDWLMAGFPDGRIVSVSIRLLSLWLRGRQMTLGATVQTVKGDAVSLDVWAKDDLDTRILSGTATVSLA